MRRCLSSLFVLFFIFGCSKFSTQFLEEKPFTDKVNPIYYSKTIDSTAEIFTIDESFRKQPIGKKDRGSYEKYSKIYFDEEYFPLKIENYRKDAFNDHIYYPYLIFKVEKQENKVMVAATQKSWQNNQLISSSMKVSYFEKEKETNIDRVMEAYKRDPNVSPFMNQDLKISFIADNSEKNKEQQTKIASDDLFLKITGKIANYPNVKVTVLFYESTRVEAAGVPIGQPIAIKVRLSKTSPEEGIEFAYISIESQNQAKEGDMVVPRGGNIEDNMYKGKKNEE